MSWPFRFIIAIAVNGLAIWLADRYIAGFASTADLGRLIGLALTLTLLNYLIKPVLKLILSPVIFLTLGVGIILVNAIILYLLDFLSVSISIDGISALLLATLLIGLVNFAFHFVTKK